MITERMEGAAIFGRDGVGVPVLLGARLKNGDIMVISPYVDFGTRGETKRMFSVPAHRLTPITTEQYYAALGGEAIDGRVIRTPERVNLDDFELVDVRTLGGQ